jgi:hypothetical protein
MLSLLALLLLGTVAAAASGVGIGTATLRRHPASLTFTVAVTLFGLFAISCLLWVLSVSFLGHRRARIDGGPAQRSRRLAAALPVLVLLVLVLFAAAHRHLRLLTPRPGAPTATGHTTAHLAVSFVPTASLSTVAAVIAVVALLLLRRRLLRWRHHRPFGHLERSDHPVEWPSDRPGSLARSLAGVRVPDPEQEPDPRRAVVAAYVAMTHVAGETGAVRRIDETPAEFLARLLDAAGASADAARHLTAVFELARYTTRPVDESLRSSAIAALHRVRAELGAAV